LVQFRGFGKSPDAGCGRPGLEGRYSGDEFLGYFLTNEKVTKRMI